MVVPLSAPTLDAASAWRAVLFGKLPSHGDFVCRGMTENERATWDGWAAQGLAAAQAKLGETFEAAHSAAPLWNFICGPGALGTQWRAGAFAPSADKAGRKFIVVAALDDLTWGEAAAHGARIAATLGDAIYRMFGERLDADAALSLIAQTPRDDGELGGVFAKLAAPAAQGVWWTYGGESHPAALDTGAAPPADLLLRALTPLEAAP